MNGNLILAALTGLYFWIVGDYQIVWKYFVY